MTLVNPCRRNRVVWLEVGNRKIGTGVFTQFRPPRLPVASQLKRAGPIAAALIAALVLVPSASAGDYTDPSGDGTTAGDIVSVTVTGDKTSGQLLFRITGTNIASSQTSPILLDIDSDANPLTGDLTGNGADYTFYVDDNSYWDSTALRTRGHSTTRSTGTALRSSR
jgi:hypothetical protein